MADGNAYRDPEPDITQRVMSVRMSASNPPLRLREPHRRGGRKTYAEKAEGMKDFKNGIPENHHDESSHELAETEAACPGPTQVCTGLLLICYGFQCRVVNGILRCANEIWMERGTGEELKGLDGGESIIRMYYIVKKCVFNLKIGKPIGETASDFVFGVFSHKIFSIQKIIVFGKEK